MAQLNLNTAQWLKLGKKMGYIKKAQEEHKWLYYKGQISQKEYKEAAMPGWKDVARIPAAIGRGVYETLGGYDPMERHDGLGSTAVSTALKDKLMKIYQMINSDPAIVNAVPRLGTAMKDMSAFVTQQQEAAAKQSKIVQRARGSRERMQEDIASGKKQVMGVPTEQQEQPSPEQGNITN
jgi:hypothetical protein